jgi:hypothetical protein
MAASENNSTSPRQAQRGWLRPVFAIDIRSLVAFRIALAVLALVAIGDHIRIWSVIHRPDGAITDQAISESVGGGLNWSLFWLSNSYGWDIVILVIGICSALAMALGWHTRLANLIVWAVVTSLNYDAPLIVGGGDVLLNLLLFWGLFLPLGQKWSVDSRRVHAPKIETIASFAAAAILLQMAMVYFFSGVSKWNETWLSGSALDYVLQNPSIVRALGQTLRDQRWLTSLLTHFTLASEFIFPLLLFSPWKNQQCRTFALLALFAFHLGIELTMCVALFSAASSVGLLPFVPSTWWGRWPLFHVQQAFDRWFPTADQSQSTEPRRTSRRRQQRQREIEQTKLFTGINPLQSVVCLLLIYVLF